MFEVFLILVALVFAIAHLFLTFYAATVSMTVYETYCNLIAVGFVFVGWSCLLVGLTFSLPTLCLISLLPVGISLAFSVAARG